MQIKVKDTRIHKVVVQSGSAFTETKEVPVADAKLVLFECDYSTAIFYQRRDDLLVIIKGYNEGPIKGIGKYFKPILISETEKIEEGDQCYVKDVSFTGIAKVTSIGPAGIVYFNEESVCYGKHEFRDKVWKILALPEHFSRKHLQAIVDGKLKEGKVAVECKKVRRKGNPIERDMVADVIGYAQEELLNSMDEDILHIIKLNPHITLHNIEEKMYTREEVRVLAKRCWGYKNESIQTFEEWFEQNVK